MTDAIATVDRIRRVLAELQHGADADWLSEIFELWVAGAAFDQAAGLSGAWRDAVAARQQETALAAIRAALPPIMSARAAAAVIASQLCRYETSAWRADHATGRRPARANGLAYDYLASGGSSSSESIRKRLAGLATAVPPTHTAA